MRVVVPLAALLLVMTVEPLALKRRGGLTKSKKKKELKKASPPVAPAPVAPAPRAPLSWSLSPEEHMAAVSNAVESAAVGIQTALADGDFFSQTDFLDARSVQAMVGADGLALHGRRRRRGDSR